MAAGMIDKPGTQYGSCSGACKHTDCALTRKMAATTCPVCLKTIGYGVRFYEREDKSLAHASCIAAEEEKEK
jgi:hypothetical protein